jgi:2,5-furandicarboxylate decarboxylase 1
VDLATVPFCVHSPKDAAPYIGSGMCTVKDPETGVQNVAMHRMHIKSKACAAIHLFSPHNISIYRKYQKMKKPMPMAVTIGHHPCWEMAACFSGNHAGYSEYEMVGSLLGEAVNLIECETVDLEVPADAEIVLEGEVPPDVAEEEGPFGEGMLYYSHPEKRPVFMVKAITMRHDAILRHLNATPFTDHQPLAALSFEVQLFSQLKQRFAVHDVHAPAWSPLSIIIQMTAHTEQQVRDALMSILFAPPGVIKMAIAVDNDIDIYDARDIFHAIATRSNPATDVVVTDGTSGFPMDPSTKQLYPGTLFRLGSKIAIDATKAPLMKAEERKRFERVSPKGWGKWLLKDFLK